MLMQESSTRTIYDIHSAFYDATFGRLVRTRIARAMPPSEYTIEDVPLSDPIFHSMLEVKKIPQVTGIGFWRAVGGQTTSERGAESAVPHFRAIRDKHGRIIARNYRRPGFVPPTCPQAVRPSAHKIRAVSKSTMESRLSCSRPSASSA
mgnify:CR=1 FL=1